ncbi:MAG: HAD-IA family hydrolase [Rhodospirillaceae bacterium]|nr:HAD-IA family hydrolase [Rhodospirillaceae bacterium]
MPLSALIFDVDGTLADTEDAHRLAFNAAFADYGFHWKWDRDVYTRLLAVTGGRARIRHFLEGAAPDMLERADIGDVIASLHKCKTDHYVAALNSGGVPLRPGVERLLREAHAESGLRLAIATTTTPVNIQALIENTLGAEALDWFDAIGAADCVENLKPAPDVYLWVLDRLGLDAADCLALEDSANGLKAASAAGLKTVITACPYTAHHDFGGALRVLGGLGDDVDVGTLRGWHGAPG